MKVKDFIRTLRSREDFDIDFTYVNKYFDFISKNIELEIDLDNKVVSLVLNDGCEREL